jgi:hypothetical protein
MVASAMDMQVRFHVGQIASIVPFLFVDIASIVPVVYGLVSLGWWLLQLRKNDLSCYALFYEFFLLFLSIW